MSQNTETTATGQCLCGGVKYEVRGPLRGVFECHCKTCRRMSGGLWHATAANRASIHIHDNGGLRWYPTSEKVRRGFCGTCGSSLFYDREGAPYIGITAGTLNDPTNLQLTARLFMSETSDYYSPDKEPPSYQKFPENPDLMKIPET